MLKFNVIALFVLGAFATAEARATGNHDPEPTPDPVATAQSDADANAVAIAGAKSTSISGAVAGAEGGDASAKQGQSQSASSDQDQSQSANNEGNAQQTTISQVYKQIKQAPDVSTSSTNTTLRCAGQWGGGVSVAGGGISFNKSRKDKDCQLLEAAEYELAVGNIGASIRLRCATTFYRDTLGEDCPALLNTVPVQKTGVYVTREELDKVVKGLLTK